MEAYGKPTVVKKVTKKRSPRGRGNDKEEEEQESIREPPTSEGDRNETVEKVDTVETEKEQR